MPLISVIVPFYNADSYLPACIESLLCQTYSNLQIILVDDGSTDNSLAVAKQFQRKHSNIELYTQSNQGPAKARNTGLKHIKGQYVTFVDADDYLDADFFKTLLSACAPLTDIIQVGYRRVKDGSTIEEKVPHSFYQFASACMRLYKTDFLHKNRLAFPLDTIYEDMLFSVDLWNTFPTYRILNYTGYNYRLTPHSRSSVPNQSERKHLYRELLLRYHQSAHLKTKLIILLTILRLKLHFCKSRIQASK